LEHMIFKGTERRPGSLDISHQLDAIGAEYNAFTSKEYTGYYAKAGAGRFDYILDILADIFLNSKLAGEEIEKERGVIIQEINMYYDDPARYIGDLHEELLYGDQPLGWRIAGPKENILSIQPESFRQYFNGHYFAENTVVAVAGSIDPGRVEEQIRRQFSGMRQQNRLEPLPVKIEQTKPGLKILNKKTDQVHLHLGVRSYDAFDPRHPTTKLLAAILGSGMSSRLFTEIREKRGLAYNVGASVNSYRDAGDLTIWAGIDQAKLAAAITVMLGELRRLKDEPVAEKELQKTKDYIQGKLAISFESSDELASFFANQELLKNEVLTPEEKMAKLNQVSTADLRAVANDIFRTDKINLALIGPLTENDPAIYEQLKL